MTIDRWLESACADADRRGLPDLKPLLAAIAHATRRLRAADWNDADAGPRLAPQPPQAGEDAGAGGSGGGRP